MPSGVLTIHVRTLVRKLQRTNYASFATGLTKVSEECFYNPSHPVYPGLPRRNLRLFHTSLAILKLFLISEIRIGNKTKAYENEAERILF